MNILKCTPLFIVLVFALTSCYTVEHTVGTGAPRDTLVTQNSNDAANDPIYGHNVEDPSRTKTRIQADKVLKQKQWYALWGAVPINEVDSKEMAGDSENYTIITKFTFGDYLISFFTSAASITVQTVVVKR
jgi:hypothetical protein